jgi:arsenite methyltransferase
VDAAERDVVEIDPAPDGTRVDAFQVLPDSGVVGSYGDDFPRVELGLWLATLGAGLVMLFAAIANAPGLPLAAFCACIVLASAALLLIWSSRVRNVRERVRCVDRLELADDAYVLDVSCGRGIVLVEAARRVPDGLAVGIDTWHASDEILIRPEDALGNAQLEGVDDRAVVATAEGAALPFPDQTFDGVSCNRRLGRFGDATRLALIRELARVLRPGGRLVVFETRRTRRLAIALRSVDLTEVARSRRVWRVIPPSRYVTATKPA